MIIVDYIKYYINHAKSCVRNHVLSCKCDQLKAEIEGLREGILELGRAKKPKHRIKNGKIELELP